MSNTTNLKPCPFCGGIPIIYGRERRDYVDPVDEDIKKETNDGWAKGTAKEFWVQPRCYPSCYYGNIHARLYGIVGGQCYISKEAAAKAWNRRYNENDD